MMVGGDVRDDEDDDDDDDRLAHHNFFEKRHLTHIFHLYAHFTYLLSVRLHLLFHCCQHRKI